MTSRYQILFVTTCIAALMAGIVAFWLFGPESVDWPAWVQAVGSVAAILAAIGISQWEAGRARRDRVETRREFRKAVAGLARRLADLIAKEADSLTDNPAFHAFEGSDKREFILTDAALERFDPSELVSAEGVLALEALRREAKEASHWEKIVGEDYTGEDYYDFDITAAIKAWRDRTEEYASTLETIAQEKH